MIVYDQPYNREFAGPRASDWDEVEAIVLELVASTRGAVEVQLPGIDADRAPYFLAASTILIETARILGSEGYSVSAREHSFSLALRLLSHM